MFAGITSGDSIFSELGDTWAVDVVTMVQQVLREVTARHSGHVVKTIGTEVMCTFPSPARAAMASGDMHLRIRQGSNQREQATTGNDDPAGARNELGLRECRLRIGVSAGSAIEEDGDLFGDVVNVAARLMGLAKSDQTLCTDVVVQQLPEELRSSIRFFDSVAPRGKQEELHIHEVLWEVDDLTMAAPVIPLPSQRRRDSTLKIACEGHEVELNSASPKFSVGRSDDNDLVCDGGFASRHHAAIEYVKGRFVLTDQSANGTYVVTEEGQLVTIRRDRHELDGSGKIYLGELPKREASAVIEFECQ
jgi:class 3 adenylate cyclase